MEGEYDFFRFCHETDIIACYDEIMDEETNSSAIRGVKPSRSKFSSIMNGLGNGAMIGGIPLLGYEFSKQIKAGELKNPLFKTSLAIAVSGCVIGAYFGLKEAEHLNDYHQALAADLKELHAKSDGKQQAPAR